MVGRRDPLPGIINLAHEDSRIRAVILNGSRARPGAELDEFSDTDVALVVTALESLRNDQQWHLKVGAPLITFPNDGKFEGEAVYNRLVLYRDGIKVDFLCWPLAVVKALADRPRLPDVLDQGYEVLIDKDSLCGGLPPASGDAFLVPQPTLKEFLDLVNEFWWETTYAVKALRRGDLIHASYNLDVVMRIRVLRKMLEWQVAESTSWRYKAKVLGRGLRRDLQTETWRELEESYRSGLETDDWSALWTTCDLFTRVARRVAASLSYPYPERLESDVREYLQSVQMTEL